MFLHQGTPSVGAAPVSVDFGVAGGGVEDIGFGLHDRATRVGVRCFPSQYYD